MNIKPARVNKTFAGFILLIVMRSIKNYKLTKDFILNKISQISIFSKYFHIDTELIQYCINTGQLICSPIRIDKHPTCGFRYDNKGKLKYKDFNGSFWGDCFDAAAFVISAIKGKRLNVSNKNDFIYILQHIAFTFSDVIYGNKKDENIENDILNALNKIRKRKSIIEVVIRDWNENDESYWKQFKVNKHDLYKHFVYPVDQYYIDKNINPQPKYYYDEKDLCYAYDLGIDKYNIRSIKLYFPLRGKDNVRFITNCNHLEGIYNLQHNDYNIILLTKSTKDRIVIDSFIDKINILNGQIKIGVINIPHETYKLRQFEYDWLNNKLVPYGQIISLMDNDETGINHALWLYNTYKIPFIFIPKRYKAKDFAELIQKTDIVEVIKTCKTFIEYGRRLSNYKKESLRDMQTDIDKPF